MHSKGWERGDIENDCHWSKRGKVKENPLAGLGKVTNYDRFHCSALPQRQVE